MGIAERFFFKISVSEIAGKLFYCEDIAMGGKCTLAAKSTGKKKQDRQILLAIIYFLIF